MEPGTHWEQVYATKAADSVSWFQHSAGLSLRLIAGAAPGMNAAIIDVGGGASALVDGLLSSGFGDVTVADLSASALEVSKARLGADAGRPAWIAGDILTLELPRHRFDIWHDRAVFHFLTDEADRRTYVAQVRRALKPGGHVVIATFAQDGPLQCSGLPVRRYGAEELAAEFGAPFTLVSHERETHVTPGGGTQSFVYCLFRMDHDEAG
jgi:ubiquinone/menaquinone biosynthesis C-methylase UbiE